jgi:uncharacterized membrane protein
MFEVGPWKVIAPYSVVPWAAVMALGFCLGPLYGRGAPVRRRTLLLLGIGALALFLLLRALNGYGDPAAWSAQATPIFSVLSFLNVTKYPAVPRLPPDDAGPRADLPGAGGGRLGGAGARSCAPSGRSGRVPLFYYVAHFYVAHLIATALAFAAYGAAAAAFVLRPYPSFGGAAENFPTGFGYGLAATYVVWLAVVAICFPLAGRVEALKARGRPAWLRYL